MVALTDTALDFCILELGLLLCLVALVLVACFPVADGPEGDVLRYTDGVGLGSCGLALFLAELGPALALCDARVDDLLDDCFLDATRGFVFFAVITDAVGYDGLGSVLVLGGGWGWECLYVVLVVFFRPVGAAV